MELYFNEFMFLLLLLTSCVGVFVITQVTIDWFGNKYNSIPVYVADSRDYYHVTPEAYKMHVYHRKIRKE